MKTFFIALSFGFLAGLGTAVHVTGYDKLKSHIWGRYQTHLTRYSLKDIREIAQSRNYIENFTQKIRGQQVKTTHRFDDTRIKKVVKSEKKLKPKKALQKQPKRQKRLKPKQSR